MEKFKQISTDDLLSLLVHEHVKIIDIRSINEYNGWKLRNENRGRPYQRGKSPAR
ncbi:MAG: hypothetical protein M1467_03490 [Deltaproteobacteria bacterium]|nr:hypothetical protein [Deltaproteobacteria bacterium]